MTTFEEKLSELRKLCNLFQDNIKQYKNSSYDEANTKVNFIDKFFKLLDWDVNNEQGFSEEYKEVVREDKVVIEGKPKAPDYSFRIGGVRKFFVEAKKPSVNIKEEIEPAFQVRRYGYTAQVPLCILTDFEEFAVYDARIKPHKEDDASVARIFYCTYLDYEKHFEFLYNTFSKNAILKGSFARYVEENKDKKGTSSVDKEILISIETWRENLAKNVALQNSHLDVIALNVSVQTILDRIIFLRIAEDRNMEKYGSLLEAAQKKDVFQNLEIIFSSAHKKYNSELFQNKTWISELKIDDRILQSIIQNLYYPDSPYEFSILPIEILGNIYEQFLGNTIRLTSNHQARVEQKEEVRKAGGVYYTPQYIVDYIIENTLGAIIKERKLDLYTHPKLTLLDPACGSGSFLVRAYDYFLNAYLQTYTSEKYLNKALKNGLIYEIAKDSYKLTIPVKQQILLDHIYGVDVDPQAVEVTKLSLLLKLLENENAESAGTLFKYSDLKLLPDLSHNVKCGNSLISSDFYKEKDLSLFGTEEMRKINAFDWEKEFPQVFNSKTSQERGFDVIVGNPPYIKIQTLTETQPHAVPYLKSKYFSAQSGNIDIYVVFLEKILSLVSPNGITGYILPHKFFQADMGVNIRRLIAEKRAIRKILNFGHIQIFESATTYTSLFFMSGSPNSSFRYAKVEGEKLEIPLSKIKYGEISSEKLFSEKWNFHTNKKGELLEKLSNMPLKLKDITRKIFQGLATSADKIYILKKIETTKEKGKILTLYSQVLEREIQIEKDLVKPFLMGKDVKRYETSIYNSYVIFPYQIENKKTKLMSSKFLKENFPLGWEYLLQNQKQLKNRERGKFKKEWWQFSRPQNLVEFETVKIMTPDISNECNFTLDDKGILYHTTTIYSIAFNEKGNLNPLFYLALLNSSLMKFFIYNIGTVLRGGFTRFKPQYMNPFPIPNLDLQNSKYKTMHDKLVSLVSEIIEVKKKLHDVKLDSDKKFLEQKFELLDSQVDHLVYQLYELTEEEIQVVEEGYRK